MKRRMKVLGVMLSGILIAGMAYGNGYKILCMKSAKATGMGEAFVVQADDPSAIAFNPAGLSQLEGNNVNLHVTMCNAYTKHTAPSGETTRMEEEWQFVPSLFATTDLGRQGMGFGIGLSLPNGLASEWAEDSFARYVATYSDLKVIDISPAVSMRVGDRFLLGAALDVYYSEARLESMADLGLQAGLPGMMDARGKMTGAGTAWGGNVGAIYHFDKQHGVALTYRLPYSIEYDGDYTLAAAGIDTGAKASIDFPAVVVAGYAYRPTDKWKLEFNADWTDWKSVGDIEIDFDAPWLPDQVQAQDLKNTIAYKLGAEYTYTDTLDLRLGYIYNENATKEATWRPSQPDTDMHFLTAGFGYDLGDVIIDGALQLVFYEDRTVNNNVDNNEMVSSSSVDGKYETFAPCLSVSATYRF